MAASMQLGPIRPVVSQTISQLALPKLPDVRSDLWLTHPSYNGALVYTFESPAHYKPRNYERLEHVGNALLGGEITLMIHEDYPQLVIGARTIVRAALVENVTLAQLAAAYGMTKGILVAKAQRNELLNGVKVQAAVFQAYLATLHEEAGYAELRQFLRAVFSELLTPIVEACRSLPSTLNSMTGQAAADNYVGALGEWENAKRRYGRLVQYDTPRGVGPSHRPIWNVTCTITFPEGGSREFEGKAETVAKAKNAAAKAACRFLEIVTE